MASLFRPHNQARGDVRPNFVFVRSQSSTQLTNDYIYQSLGNERSYNSGNAFVAKLLQFFLLPYHVRLHRHQTGKHDSGNIVTLLFNRINIVG